MKKIRFIIKTVNFLIGFIIIIGTIGIFYPQGIEKAKNLVFKNSGSQVNQKATGNVLGENQDLSYEKLREEIKKEIQQWLQKIKEEEFVQQFTSQINDKINQQIQEKSEQIKKIPEQQIEEMKRNIRRQIYQEVCNQWLQEK